MSVQRPTLVKTSLGFLVLSLLTALSLAIAPAQAQNLFATGQTQDLFVANQTTNTIREFSPTGVDLGDFATTGIERTHRPGLRQARQSLRLQHLWQHDSGVLSDWCRPGRLRYDGAEFSSWHRLRQARQPLRGKRQLDSGVLSDWCRPGQLRHQRAKHRSWHRLRQQTAISTSPMPATTRFGSSLGPEKTWASSPPPGFRNPALIAFDKRGNLYVTNFDGNTIREFSPTGVDLGDFATTGLSTPAGLAFDKYGNLYVSNRGDGTIRKFSRSGVDLGYFATTGMITPVGLAFGPKAGDENGD